MSAPSIWQLPLSDWQAAIPLDAAALAWAVTYAWAARRVRGRWPLRRTIAFLAGVACVVVALQSGIGAYDDRLLSVHMVQHMLLLLVAPLLLLASRPTILVLRTLPPRHRARAARFLDAGGRLAQPIQCLAVFYAVLLLTHVPAVYDATLRHPVLHDLEHLSYLAAGLLLWSPILDVDPAPARRLSGLGRVVYVLATMPPMAVVGAYLNRHPSLVYAAYASPARALGVSAVGDQQQAGAIMWVVGNLIMVAVGLWAAMAALVAEERRQQLREARAAQPLTYGGPER